MSTHQEYWDACLIKTWRKAGTVLDALSMFSSVTNTRVDQCELLRVPTPGYPWRIGIRVFVAHRLSKISEWLWDRPPEKDIFLLRKLTTSRYDTANGEEFRDKDLQNEMNALHKNKNQMAMESLAYSNRNNDTNGNVTKGRARTRRAR